MGIATVGLEDRGVTPSQSSEQWGSEVSGREPPAGELFAEATQINGAVV